MTDNFNTGDDDYMRGIITVINTYNNESKDEDNLRKKSLAKGRRITEIQKRLTEELIIQGSRSITEREPAMDKKRSRTEELRGSGSLNNKQKKQQEFRDKKSRQST
jgi:hypothetical protein